MSETKRALEPYQKIERSLQTKFRKTIWNPFIEAVKRYELIAAGDRIAADGKADADARPPQRRAV